MEKLIKLCADKNFDSIEKKTCQMIDGKNICHCKGEKDKACNTIENILDLYCFTYDNDNMLAKQKCKHLTNHCFWQQNPYDLLIIVVQILRMILKMIDIQ